jgi:scyllo-inositol 2-dehydrogenase (NADP+)
LIRAALIGLGKMGISHQAIVNAHPDIDLVAICDPADYVRDVLQKFTGVRGFSDYRKMLTDEKLDAVFIATPSRFHAEMVGAALDHGLHVFCEKPFCLDVSEGKRLAEKARAKGLVNQVGYHYRFVGSFIEVKRLIDAGALGKLHHIRAEAYGPVVLRPKGSTWRGKRSEGGGCLYDYASHALDLINYLVGSPAEVGGTVLNQIFSRDVEDEVYSTLYFKDGMTGQLCANWSDDSFRKMSMIISVWGSNGRVTANRQEMQTFLRSAQNAPEGYTDGWNVRYTTELTDEVLFYLRGEEYSAQIDHFVEAVKLNLGNTRSTFATAVETDMVADALFRDAKGSAPHVSVAEVGSSIAPVRGRGLRARLKTMLRAS